MGVLYKLSRCGVRGTMLRWLQAYLKDRPFKVFMEGTYSSKRIARIGVPQGAVLSPLLFNIMMYDTPVEEGICSLGGQQLEFTKQFKYLGVMLDSPQLRWHHQVEYLKQSIPHKHWGADRELLIYLYKTLIRSQLDYAAPLYGTAALSNLLQLNSIQNHCLRITTGCRKTSPAASLKGEANIFPLTIHRDLLTCQYCSKIQQLPNDMADDLLQAQFPAEGLSSRLLPSMKSRARALFTNVDLQIPTRNAAPLVSPLPPWFKVETYICIDFLPTSVSSQTNQNVLQMYQELIDTNYPGYTHIFTDGSCIVEPTCSASAAVVISSRGVTINFKLRPQIHIMECELIAINEALQWILLNNCQEEKFVIFSDSLSALHLIQNTRPKNYRFLLFNIQDKLFNIAASHWVYLQFIPGHKGIPGNEAADEAAKNAHLLRYRTLMPSSYEEIKNLTNTAFKTKWKTEWLKMSLQSYRVVSDYPSTAPLITSYADDFTALATTIKIPDASAILSTHSSDVATWAQQKGLTVSIAKSQSSLFTPDTHQYRTNPHITCEGTNLTHCRCPKIQEITFDPHFTFTPHINTICERARHRLNILKALAGSSWGQQKETITLTFKALINSIVTYAAPIWFPNASPSSIAKLQTIQNVALRIASGSHKMASASHLHRETGLLPLTDHLDLFCSQYLLSSIRPHHPNYLTVTQPSGPRSMKHTLHSRFPSSIAHLL
ncbi:Ribonuclease H domain [Trinorchestia longiramus]|nr:Ribonuclease H domain [Trinorchestia longiramus]